MKHKYNYFYKITNNINNHFYYGIHSTDNLDDGYMGSGSRLHLAYKKYGIENFTKEILKFFDTREECANYEMEIVNETLVKDDNCYNIKIGGDSFCTCGTITAKDKEGNITFVYPDDPRWISGELVGSTKYNITCFDNILNKYVHIPKTEYDTNRDRYNSIMTIKHIVYDTILKKHLFIYKEDIDKTRHKGVNTNKILCKDNTGKYYMVDNNDERYLSGKIVPIWKDRKHSEETKNKMREKFKKSGHQKGEKNSQYGTCWIMKNNKSIKIKTNELTTYLNDGWVKGRKCKK